MSRLPYPTRLLLTALRAEAQELVVGPETPGLIDRAIAGALCGVADRLEQTGSTLRPRTPASAPDGATVSASDPWTRSADLEERMHEVHAILLDLKGALGGRLHNDQRASSMLEEALTKTSS